MRSLNNRLSSMALVGMMLGMLIALPSVPANATAARPNILIIMADDCTFSDLPLYGGPNAQTPNIDRLATLGLTFNRAYLCEAMCQPCRAELYTGQYPMRNGCAWNHSASRSNVTSMPHHLRKLGYRVGLAGKGHVKPAKAFPFDKVAGFDPSCVRNPTKTHDLTGITKYMKRDGEKPFCLVIALVEPHVPWVMGDASQYPAGKIKLPANIADTQRTREDFGNYLAEITYMDSQVGEILNVLDQSGKANDTLVLFTSEQGAQFPGCKWTNWDTGLHTALVARWPGKIEAGKRTDALVQYADMMPTLIDVAGGDVSKLRYDGSSMKRVLIGEAQQHRKYAYGLHNNIPEGPAYPIRSITDGRYHYIRNLTPNEIYIEKHLMGMRGDGKLNNPYWSTWKWAAANDPQAYELVKRYVRRPKEEVYDLTSDPYELTNIALDSQLIEKKNELSSELDRWLKSQGDPGVAQDTIKAIQAARRGQHLYTPK